MCNYSGSQLRLENGQTVMFPHRIKECRLVDNVIVVVLDVPPDVSMTENVYGVSPGGEILWQIERTPGMSTDPTDRFEGITGVSPGKVQITNWNGIAAQVDIHSGKIISTRFVH